MFGEETNVGMQNVVASLKANRVPCEVFSGEEVRDS